MPSESAVIGRQRCAGFRVTDRHHRPIPSTTNDDLLIMVVS
jgi:hypothetical protein